MTTPINKAEDGVHRLVDMVVEEVSLVDRAANKHRFLIVKRDEAMDDDDNTTDNITDAPSPPAAPTEKLDDGTALGAALAALESLTGLVELLGSLGADQADARLAELAEELRAVAEALLARTVGDDEVEARAKGDDDTPAAPADFAGNVTAAKQALARLAELATKVPSAKTETPAEPAPASAAKEAPATATPTPSVTESLAKLAESFRALSDTVKEQQQRLGRVEKQFGLPNSAASAERVSKATVEDVGWPLDLNKPKDRESVDKAISFHDL